MGASTKFLYVIVLAVVVLAIYFLLTAGLNKTANALLDQGAESLKTAGICGLNTFGSKCSVSTDSLGTNCLSDFDCTLCERQVGGATVYKCSVAVCGCGFGWDQSSCSVKVSLDETAYKAGGELEASGRTQLTIVKDLTGSEVILSFLDADKKPTDRLGGGGTASAEDREGNFRWSYTIPSGSEAGKYFLLAESEDCRGVVEFNIAN